MASLDRHKPATPELMRSRQSRQSPPLPYPPARPHNPIVYICAAHMQMAIDSLLSGRRDHTVHAFDPGIAR